MDLVGFPIGDDTLQSAHGKLVEKVLTMEHFSDEDERCLLHLIDSLEGKNKLRVLVEGLK